MQPDGNKPSKARRQKRERTRRGIGELKVYESGGRWIAPVRIPGQPRPLRIYGVDEADALTKRQTWREEIARGFRDSSGLVGRVGDRKIVFLSDWLEYWLSNVVEPIYDAKGERTTTYQPTTYQNYRWALERYVTPRLGKIKLVDLRTSHVETWYRDLIKDHVATTSAFVARKVLVTALEAGLRRRQETHLTHNPAKGFQLRKAPSAQKPPPDPALITRILDQAEGDRLGLAIHLALFLGLRRQEIGALQWQDFDLGRGELLIRRRVNRIKGQKIALRGGSKMGDEAEVQRIQIDRAEWGARLQAHRQLALEFYAKQRAGWTGPDPRLETSFLFTNRNGQVLDPNLMYRWMKEVFTRAGAPGKTMHSLRHDYAGILADSDLSLLEISRALRHKNTAVTDQIYTHLTNERSRTVVGKAAAWITAARFGADGALLDSHEATS
jgi:integrase